MRRWKIKIIAAVKSSRRKRNFPTRFGGSHRARRQMCKSEIRRTWCGVDVDWHAIKHDVNIASEESK